MFPRYWKQFSRAGTCFREQILFLGCFCYKNSSCFQQQYVSTAQLRNVGYIVQLLGIEWLKTVKKLLLTRLNFLHTCNSIPLALFFCSSYKYFAVLHVHRASVYFGSLFGYLISGFKNMDGAWSGLACPRLSDSEDKNLCLQKHLPFLSRGDCTQRKMQ